uniref:SFRICE_020570 n=1 Tax=Spodoptera frugiperda TaxID=7108 RepID=A0A2H1WBZ2_SPOFR
MLTARLVRWLGNWLPRNGGFKSQTNAPGSLQARVQYELHAAIINFTDVQQSMNINISQHLLFGEQKVKILKNGGSSDRARNVNFPTLVSTYAQVPYVE